MEEEYKEEDIYDLDDAIQTGLDRMENATDTNDFCDNGKIVRDLYDVKIKARQVSNDYWAKKEELDNKRKELEEANKLQNRVNPNTVLTCGTGIVLTVATMVYEGNGHLFRISDVGKLMIGLFAKNK